MTNKSIQTLILDDCDLGADGGEILGKSLASNTTLRELSLVDNAIKVKGASSVIKNSNNLVRLNLARNQIKHSVGFSLSQLLEKSRTLKILVLDYNEL